MKINEAYETTTHAPESDADRAPRLAGEARAAFLAGELDRGWELTEQIPDAQIRHVIETRLLAARVFPFHERWSEGTLIAQNLFEAYPTFWATSDQYTLNLMYEKKYIEAWRIYSWMLANFPEHCHDFNGACLLAKAGLFAEALKTLRGYLQQAEKPGWRKVWYDPELCDLWEAVGNYVRVPEIDAELQHPIWQELLESFDATARFDRLDPGNLEGWTEAERRLVSFNASTLTGYINDEAAASDPYAYGVIIERLGFVQWACFTCLRFKLSLLASERWQADQAT